LLGRRVARPFRLGEFELPRGAAIFVAQIVTHRNPSLWHEPERFRPERWSNGETRALPRFAYFPFGGGNRGCIGEQFAWTEAILALATLARCFRFRSLDPSPVPLEPSVTLRPARPILMRVEARDALVGV
jgi:cytochrome P450